MEGDVKNILIVLLIATCGCTPRPVAVTCKHISGVEYSGKARVDGVRLTDEVGARFKLDAKTRHEYTCQKHEVEKGLNDE